MSTFFVLTSTRCLLFLNIGMFLGQVFLSKKVFFYTCRQCKWRWFVSNNDEEPYSSIFASLKHPVRRKILRMLSKKPMSYSEMLEVLGVSNSFLTYHLENLGELVGKMADGRYRLSTFGEDAMATMTRVEDIPVNTLHQSPQTKPKKIVWKSVPFALGLICIVLIAFIAYFAVAGISAQNSYNNLKNQNNQLQTWLAGNETLLNQAQSWLSGNETLLSQTQANNTSLQNQIASLKSIVTNLQEELYPNSAYTVFGVLDGLELNMTLEKVVYSLGEPINVTLTLTNISNQTATFGLGGLFPFYFEVYNSTNGFVYSSIPSGIIFIYPPISNVTLPAGESLSENLSWQPKAVPALLGTYYIDGQVGNIYYLTNNGEIIYTTPMQITID